MDSSIIAQLMKAKAANASGTAQHKSDELAGNVIRIVIILGREDASAYGTMAHNAVVKMALQRAAQVGHTGGYYFYEPVVVAVDDFVTKQLYWRKYRGRADVLLSAGPEIVVQLIDGVLRTDAERQRWIHVASVERLVNDCAELISACHSAWAIERPLSSRPVISVITTAFRSGERIRRPWESLLAQDAAYSNWEWIVIDDNFNANGESSQFRDTLDELTGGDPRVIPLRAGHDHSGYIGELKLRGSSVASGDYLVELDHDDALVPGCFERLLTFLTKSPAARSCGFIYSDTIELFEGTHAAFSYGTTFAFGTGSTYRVYKPDVHGKNGQGTVQAVSVAPPIGPLGLAHIVGAPNHVRIWRKDVYRAIGGHNPRLSVADDYDLILRTFAHKNTLIAKMCYPEYLQYRNESASNFTVKRNAMIQHYVPLINAAHRSAVDARFTELRTIATSAGSARKTQFLGERFEVPWDPLDVEGPCISVIMPTYNRPVHLKAALDSVLAQTWRNWVIYIIGDKCPELDAFMPQFIAENDGVFQNSNLAARVRWFNLDVNYGAGGAVPRNYALERLVSTHWVAYLDDDNVWDPDHLSSAVACMREHPDAKVILGDFFVDTTQERICCTDPPKRGSVDTSSVVHRRDLIYQHGLWKSRVEVGYAHDWEFFSRWFTAGVPYALTHKATLMYNTQFNGQSAANMRRITQAPEAPAVTDID